MRPSDTARAVASRRLRRRGFALLALVICQLLLLERTTSLSQPVCLLCDAWPMLLWPFLGRGRAGCIEAELRELTRQWSVLDARWREAMGLAGHRSDRLALQQRAAILRPHLAQALADAAFLRGHRP